MTTADTVPAPVIQAPVQAPIQAPTHATDGLRRLRSWITAQGLQSADPGQAIRDEFQRTALSATVRRLFFFGVESSLTRYSARELLQFQLIISGDFSVYFARITWSRAVVEDDGAVLQALADSGPTCPPPPMAWKAKSCMSGACSSAVVIPVDSPSSGCGRFRNHCPGSARPWYWRCCCSGLTAQTVSGNGCSVARMRSPVLRPTSCYRHWWRSAPNIRRRRWRHSLVGMLIARWRQQQHGILNTASPEPPSNSVAASAPLARAWIGPASSPASLHVT